MLADDYLPVAVFAIIAMLFPVIAFWATRFLRPDKPTEIKATTYECGEIPEGEAQIQFHFQYYMYAIIFVVFDVVTVFLMLWALVFADLESNAKVFMFVFLAVLMLGVTYALKKEAKIWI